MKFLFLARVQGFLFIPSDPQTKYDSVMFLCVLFCGEFEQFDCMALVEEVFLSFFILCVLQPMQYEKKNIGNT